MGMAASYSLKLSTILLAIGDVIVLLIKSALLLTKLHNYVKRRKT